MRSPTDGDAGHELEREVVLAVGLAGVEQADEMAVLDRARRARLAQQAPDEPLRRSRTRA